MRYNIPVISSRAQYAVDFLLLAIVAALFFLWNLDSPSFWRGDESVYVLGTQATYQSGNFWYPSWISNGREFPFWMKPPLRLWIGIISISLLGDSNVTHRLPDALAAYGILVVTFLFTLHLFKSRFSAHTAAITLLTSSNFLFLHGPRQVSLDMLLLLLQLITLYAGWRTIESVRDDPNGISYRWALIGGVACGLGIMTKSIAALIPFGLLFAYALSCPDRLYLLRNGWRSASTALGTALVIGLPYFLFHCTFTTRACHPLVYEDIFLRSTQGFINRSDYLMYARELFLARTLIPPELLILSLLGSAALILREPRGAHRFLLLWAALPLIVFSFLPTRLPWYAYLSLPPMAILVGFLCSMAISKCQAGGVSRLIGVTIFVIIAISLASPLEQNLTRIGTAQPRLLLDTFVHQLNARTPTPRMIGLDIELSHPQSESTYRGMLKRPFQTVHAPQEVPPDARFIATHPENSAALMATIPMQGYLRLAPLDGRKRWIIIFDRGPGALLSDFEPTDLSYEMSSIEKPLLFGWGDIGEKHGVRYRRTRDTRAALELPGNYLLFQQGAILELGLQATKKTPIRLSLDGSHLFDYFPHNRGFSTITVPIPPGALSAGRHQLLIEHQQTKSPLKVSFLRMRLNQNSPRTPAAPSSRNLPP